MLRIENVMVREICVKESVGWKSVEDMTHC